MSRKAGFLICSGVGGGGGAPVKKKSTAWEKPKKNKRKRTPEGQAGTLQDKPMLTGHIYRHARAIYKNMILIPQLAWQVTKG